jgi:xylose isomerase
MSRHSICAWTFNHSGEAGFRPGIRQKWSGISTPEVISMVGKEIKQRIPYNIEIGFEVHYDNEINEENAKASGEALKSNGIYLAMITPGLHKHFAYGGPASIDTEELKEATRISEKTVDLAYGSELKDTWHPEVSPTLVLWNGSWGYDIPGPWLKEMMENLEQGIAGIINYEKKKGGKLYIAVEPKPNEGHPAMLLPTVGSVLALKSRLAKKGVDVSRFGTNKEFGHTEMIGLDTVSDTVEEILDGSLFHVHANSQGYDGILAGGPGKYDIDNGAKITGSNISIMKLLIDAGYQRWIGHDMQARPHDNEQQAINRVIESVINIEAMEKVARNFPTKEINNLLAKRDTQPVESMMHELRSTAEKYAREMLKEAGLN